MGHHELHPLHNPREAAVIQKRIVTFLIIFSVTAVAFVLLIASVQRREASCQARANAGLYSIYVRPDGGNASILAALATALQSNGVRMAASAPEGPTRTQLDLLDTGERTLQGEGFALLRALRGTGGNVHWQLRYVDRSLCTRTRRISMEALPNVDYEKVTYHIKALGVAGMPAFLYISDVLTKSRDRITTYPQLQSLFPGFHAHASTPRMVRRGTFTIDIIYSAELYYRGSPLDIQLQVEEWEREDENAKYWRIVVSSSNPLVERNLEQVSQIITEVAKKENFVCDMVSCGNTYDNPFFQ